MFLCLNSKAKLKCITSLQDKDVHSYVGNALQAYYKCHLRLGRTNLLLAIWIFGFILLLLKALQNKRKITV